MKKTLSLLASCIALSCLLLGGCGGGSSSSGGVTHSVTTSTGTGGTISPTSATVDDGATTSFTVTADTGYSIDTVSGCGGTLSGTTYTTGAITADCTVTATFSIATVYFYNGEGASVVVGQSDFTSNTLPTAPAATSITSPTGNPDVINGALYLADSGMNRVLGFNTLPTGNAPTANFALGAADLTSSGSLAGAAEIADDGSALYVATPQLMEWNPNQNFLQTGAAAVYNTVPTTDTQNPDLWLTGNSAGLDQPQGVATGGGKLVVADGSDNRVLIWNTIPTTDTAPDLVLGQANFSDASTNAGGTPAAGTLSSPTGVWTDGQRLVVVDSGNNRVLIWNTFPMSIDQPADLVLGQADFNSSQANQGLGAPTDATLSGPSAGVYVHGDQLFVADSGNGRVMIWNSWPTQNGQAADTVLGQQDFTTTSSAGPQRDIMDNPQGLYLSGTKLIVGDYSDNRYLIFTGDYSQTPATGAALYETVVNPSNSHHCYDCHSQIGESQWLDANITAADINDAITNPSNPGYSSMNGFSSVLTTADMNAIAAALNLP